MISPSSHIEMTEYITSPSCGPSRKGWGGHFLQLLTFSCFLMSIPLSLSELERGTRRWEHPQYAQFTGFFQKIYYWQYCKVNSLQVKMPFLESFRPTNIFLKHLLGKALVQELFLGVFSYLFQISAICIMLCFLHHPDATLLKKSGGWKYAL